MKGKILRGKRGAGRPKRAGSGIPQYEADDGPLTREQIVEIRRLVAQRSFVGGKTRLF